MDREYNDWLLDRRRDAHRVVLFKAPYGAADDAVRLSYPGWRSDKASGYAAWDGWIMNSIRLRQTLDEIVNVGNFRAVNPAGDVRWPELPFRGRSAELLHGDATWPLAEFRRIATPLLDGCNPLDGNIAEFVFSDAGDVMNRPTGDADETRTGTARAVMDGLAASAGAAAPRYLDVPAERLAWPVSVALTDATTLGEALVRVAASLGARVRPGRDGRLEVLRPTAGRALGVEVTADDLVGRAVETRATVHAVARVRVQHVAAEGASDVVTRATGADTGAFDEAATLDTALTNRAHAEELADELAQRYARPRPVRRLPLHRLGGACEVGMELEVRHPDYAGRGLIVDISRELPGPFTTVDIET